jgi:hypothetical protein
MGLEVAVEGGGKVEVEMEVEMKMKLRREGREGEKGEKGRRRKGRGERELGIRDWELGIGRREERERHAHNCAQYTYSTVSTHYSTYYSTYYCTYHRIHRTPSKLCGGRIVAGRETRHVEGGAREICQGARERGCEGDQRTNSITPR